MWVRPGICARRGCGEEFGGLRVQRRQRGKSFSQISRSERRFVGMLRTVILRSMLSAYNLLGLGFISDPSSPFYAPAPALYPQSPSSPSSSSFPSGFTAPSPPPPPSSARFPRSPHGARSHTSVHVDMAVVYMGHNRVLLDGRTSYITVPQKGEDTHHVTDVLRGGGGDVFVLLAVTCHWAVDICAWVREESEG
jgi:hypothetical protein